MGYLEKTIVVNAPVAMCYNHWSNVANYPRFMQGITRVEPAEESAGEAGRFQWTGRTPSGGLARWEMILDDVLPNQMIAWRSAADNPVFQTEIVHFDPVNADQCQVTLTRTFHDPAGSREEFCTERCPQTEERLAHDLKAFKTRVEHVPNSSAVRMVPQRTLDFNNGTYCITAWPAIRVPVENPFPEAGRPGEIPDISGEYSNIGVSESTRKSDFEWF